MVVTVSRVHVVVVGNKVHQARSPWFSGHCIITYRLMRRLAEDTVEYTYILLLFPLPSDNQCVA